MTTIPPLRLTPAEQDQAFVIFSKLFPGVFFPRGAACRPLAVGVRAGLAQAFPELDAARLGLMLACYCNANRYLRALTARGARRVALDGSDAGPVDPCHAEFAAAQLRGRIAKREAEAARFRAERVERRVAHARKVAAPGQG